MLVVGAEASKFSMDGVQGRTGDGSTVCDAGAAQNRLVVPVVEQFLGEEVFEFKPSCWLRRIACSIFQLYW